MNRELKVGDRVRVVAPSRMANGYSGNKGTVRSGPHSAASGVVYYLLAMDGDARGGTFLFTAKEVEPERTNDFSLKPARNRAPEGKPWANQREKS
jgi:hypothetical protein